MSGARPARRPRGAGRGRRLARIARRACTLALVAGALAVESAAAVQEPPPEDSIQARLRRRLERLARPPGADSILFLQDSLRLAEIQAGRRPGASSADSTPAALLSLPGFTLTEYQGGHATFGAERRLLALHAPEDGRAVVNREGMEVQADTSITYDEATGRVRTVGQSSFSPPTGDPVESGSLIYDLQSQRGSAFAARTSYSQGSARWHVTGDMPYAATDSTFLSHARFTSCDLEEPHYHFETDEIKIVGNSVLVARPVRLYFADVPVAWLPFIAQSLSSGRSSGLLTPRFSVNDIVRTSSGYSRRISNLGFYWAMSEYTDAILALDWWSENFTALNGSVRYRWTRQFLEGALNARSYWRNDGSTEYAFDTRHSWEMDERTQFRMSGRYSTSTDFVRESSFNTREVVQSIDSEGGLQRRFDWGSLSLQANRKEYLNDDRVEWTLPSLGLSMSTVTLFRAPSARAGFFNNATWSGSANYTRRTVDRAWGEGVPFDRSLLSTTATNARFGSSLSFGGLSISPSITLQEDVDRGIPEAFLARGDSAPEDELLVGAPARDVTRATLTWQTSVNYQQQLIGSTTLTPRLSISGNQFRSDTSSLASSFVAAPTRVTFGATLKTDIYGIRSDVFGYQAIRHKLSPSFEYNWSPETRPDELQSEVFGRRVLQPRNALSVTLNQTWEAKRREPEADSAQAGAGPPAGAGEPAPAPGEPRRPPRADIITLLALRTSVVEYDFVEADSVGTFLSGFQTTRLSNQISSDFLRGLSLSVDHDLFEDEQEEESGFQRRFAPHLQSVNLSFSLNNRSAIFRWLGSLTGLGGALVPLEEEEPLDDLGLEPEDPLLEGGATDESSIVPSEDVPVRSSNALGPNRRGGSGWNASLSYALTRPRGDEAEVRQMLNGTLTLNPTEHWDMSWRTAYDIEAGAFNDHSIRLSRDLHRWRANFDFVKAANGNWRFRFEVSLIDNQDLKFDYEQRNLDAGLARQQRTR